MKRKAPSKLLISILLSLLLTRSSAAQDVDSAASPSPKNRIPVSASVERLEDLTRKILLNEIELERFNMHFRQEVGRQGRWKGWRYFLSQQANFSLSEAGSIVSVSERMSNIHKPHQPSRQVLKHAAALQTIGPIISSAGSGLELGIDVYHRYRAYRMGLSPGVAKKQIWRMSDELDNLFAQREALIKEELAQPDVKVHAEIAEAEGKVLEDIRYLLVAEYRSFHLDARRFFSFEQSLYLLDIAKRSVGAVAGGLSYRSQRLGDRMLNRPIGVFATVSGALVIAAPILSREIGKLSAAYHDRHLKLSRTSREDIFKELVKLEADRSETERLVESSKKNALHLVSKSASRLAVYESVDKQFLHEMNIGLKEERAGVRSATENIMAGAFSGSTTLVSGILLTRAGYSYADNGLISNSLIGSGATTNLAGNSFAFLDNIRIQVQREWTRRRLSKQHALPNQLLEIRLNELDAMEKQIGASEPSQ